MYAMTAIGIYGYVYVRELGLYLIRLIANLEGCTVGRGQAEPLGLALIATA